MFLGSVDEVLRHAPCAVLVIPPLRLYSPPLDVARAVEGGALAAAGEVECVRTGRKSAQQGIVRGVR